MGSKGGDILIQLIDASMDKKTGKLYVIFAKHGNNLREWCEGKDGLWFLESDEKKSRKEVWKHFFSLLKVQIIRFLKLYSENTRRII